MTEEGDFAAAPRTVAIFGLGLIGGSAALALRQQGRRIIGMDRESVLARPEAEQAADDLVDVADRPRVRQAMMDAALTILAAPVGVIEAIVGETLAVAPMVTDCGSTKRAIVRAATASPRAGRFVGGHPMAGRPQGGIENARADLFQGRAWILCDEHADPDARDGVRAVVRALGARVVSMTAEAHDRAVALTSHVPQLLASLLAVMATSAEARAAAGPAFESATRVAGGAEPMWHGILSTNADEVAAALRQTSRRLDEIARALERSPADVSAALELLAEARRVSRP